MNRSANKNEKLSTLDYVFTVLSCASSRLDFAFVLHFDEPLCVEKLKRAALSARNKYPITSSVVQKGKWKHSSTLNTRIEVAATTDERSTVENFINVAFDVTKEAPCRQLLITAACGGSILVSHFHHAAADGVSAAMWIGHELNVAFGLEQRVNTPAFFSRPQLRHVSPSVRRSKFAYSRPSDPLATTGSHRSGKRNWLTFDFDGTQLRRACRMKGGFTYNDLLATLTLGALDSFNAHNGGFSGQQIGLWVPMNIRHEAINGFGNGTSRIRLYPRYSQQASIADKAREIRSQVSWCTEHGEWVVPGIPLLTKLPRWVTSPLLRRFLNHRSVDMATAVFSHSDSWGGGAGGGLQAANRIECIGLVHPRQSVAINGTTHRGRTSLTITYDSGLITESEAQQLSEIYQEQVDSARKELS